MTTNDLVSRLGNAGVSIGNYLLGTYIHENNSASREFIRTENNSTSSLARRLGASYALETIQYGMHYVPLAAAAWFGYEQGVTIDSALTWASPYGVVLVIEGIQGIKDRFAIERIKQDKRQSADLLESSQLVN